MNTNRDAPDIAHGYGIVVRTRAASHAPATKSTALKLNAADVPHADHDARQKIAHAVDGREDASSTNLFRRFYGILEK